MTLRQAALVAIALTILPACSDDEPREESNTTATVVATTVPPAVVSIEHQPGTGEFTGALDDIDNLTCQPTAAGWTAAGIVTNPTDANADYRIYVSFVDNNGETLGLTETNVLAEAPTTSAEWSVTFATATANVECVLRVERRVSTP